MERVSPYELCKKVERQLQAKLSGLDVPSLPREEQTIIHALRQAVTDARLTIRDYEVADTRAEQVSAAQEAKDFLEQAQKSILTASSYGVFGPADVAHLSANLEQIADHLQ